MKAQRQTRTFSEIIKDYDTLEKCRAAIMPSCPEFTQEEYAALIGRYGESHTRYTNEGQFLAQFFTISLEGLPRLRAKLRANDKMRNLSDDEVLEGEKYTTTDKEIQTGTINQASNPDTEPPTEEFESLPYIQGQEKSKAENTREHTEARTLGKVSGLYFYKHSLGSQAYGEWLDSYRDLFRKILSTDEEYYYRKEY